MSQIRKADFRDAAQLARLAEQTFRDTFAAQNTAEDMDLHCRDSYGVAIQASEIFASNMVTLVAEEEGRMIGYAQVRWDRHPACVEAASPGEIQRIYVQKEWQGRGVAHDLMQASLAEIQRRGSDVVWLGVWERNPRAISFYRKLGFVAVGDHVFPLGRDPQRDIVMARSIAPAG